MASPLRFFDALPRELLPCLLPFLSGFDLLPLSHASKLFYTELLGANSAFWVTHAPRAMRVSPYEWRELATFGWDRVDPVVESGTDREAARQLRRAHKALLQRERTARADELRAHAKRRYFDSISLLFSGLQDSSDDTSRRKKVGSVVLVRHGVSVGERWALGTFSFSLDVWLALLPAASSDGVAGGVVFSAYSYNRQQPDARVEVAHFVHVDPHGHLYCSVASGAKRVVATLALSRWYHVALTFDRSGGNNSAVQCVYLDGVCIDTRHGVALPDNWAQLIRYQLGTGLVDEKLFSTPETRNSSGFRSFLDAIQHWRRARPHFCGNYGFNGLLDEFRLWRGLLSPDDIQELIQGRDDLVEGRIACDWSLTVDPDYRSFYGGDLWAVQCTRPSERQCLDIRTAFRVWGHDRRPHHR